MIFLKKRAKNSFYGAELISKVARESNCDVVVDIGSGIGYLSSTLMVKHHLNVVGLERNPKLNESAAKRVETIMKRKIEGKPQNGAEIKFLDLTLDPLMESKTFEEMITRQFGKDKKYLLVIRPFFLSLL